MVELLLQTCLLYVDNFFFLIMGSTVILSPYRIKKSIKLGEIWRNYDRCYLECDNGLNIVNMNAQYSGHSFGVN